MARPPMELDLVNINARAPSWMEPPPQAANNSFLFKALYYWAPEVAIFLNSHTDLEDDQDWRPIRALGKGGNGVVGLWQKFDQMGRVVDSIAIKQQKHRPTVDNDPSFEPQLMDYLNSANCNNIIKLRGFKDHQQENLWRFYFEYAPFGNLHDLKINYMAWNTYLPEEFLWHVFHGLATAGLQLAETVPWEHGPQWRRDNERAALQDDCFVVHFDLKPQNVVLGDLVDKMPTHFSNYPVAKMMDFGLARVTGPGDKENPTKYWGLATPGYQPPVRWSNI
jgi:serine/threonine protein kinase